MIYRQRPRPGSHGSRRGCSEVFAFVSAHQAHYPVATLCRVLGISEERLLRID